MIHIYIYIYRPVGQASPPGDEVQRPALRQQLIKHTKTEGALESPAGATGGGSSSSSGSSSSGSSSSSSYGG